MTFKFGENFSKQTNYCLKRNTLLKILYFQSLNKLDKPEITMALLVQYLYVYQKVSTFSHMASKLKNSYGFDKNLLIFFYISKSSKSKFKRWF